MAPFKFGKKSSKDKDKNKNKNSKENSNNSPKGSPSRFLHIGNNNHNTINDNIGNINNNNPVGGNLFARNNQNRHNNNSNFNNNSNNNGMFNNQPMPQQQQQQQPQQQSYPSPAPQFPTFEQANNKRMFPTPIPEQQRNVSGATAMPLVYDSTNKQQPQLPSEKTVWNRVKLANSPFPRYRHVASAYASDDDKVYVIGGLHDQSVYGDTWIIKSENNATKFTSQTVDIGENTPPPRVGHASTLCGNAFVIFGGDTHKVNQDGLMDDDIYLFNINSFKWTIPHPVGPRPLGRYGHKISVIATNQMKTKLYLFGGQFDETYFNDLTVFDLSSFRRQDAHWEFLKPKTFTPPPLTNHTMVSYAHKLWVFGGDTQQGLLNKIFMYDPIINDWSIIEPRNIGGEVNDIPPPMQEHATIVYKDLMVVVGGKDEQDIYLNSVFFFNLKTFKWFKLPVFSLGIPQGRSGHSVSLLKNNKLLIMGGDKFDYAAIDDNNLHTSDVNMGKGTILYTLDLTRLEELCPGIMDEVSTPITGDTPHYNIPFNNMDNDILNDSERNNNQQDVENQPMNKSPMLNTTPTTKSTATNPIQIQNNILTPYTDPEYHNTPMAENTEIFQASTNVRDELIDEQKTPVVIEQTKKSPLGDHVKNMESPLFNESPVKSDITSSATDVTNVISPVSEQQKDVVRSPVIEKNGTFNKSPVLKQNIVDENSLVPGDASVTSATLQPDEDQAQSIGSDYKDENLEDEFQDSETHETEQLNKLDAVQMSPDMSDLDEQNASVDSEADETIEHNTLDELIPSPKLEYIPSDNELHEGNETTTEPLDTEPEMMSKKIAVVNDDPNMTVISKQALEGFRTELQNLRDVANEKSIEASNHVRDLENQIIRLKGITKRTTSLSTEDVSVTKLQNKCDILTADNHIMRDRVLELESLVSDKFLDLENLNGIIKQQRDTIDGYEQNKDVTEENNIDQLRYQIKVLEEENKAIKNDLQMKDTSLNRNIGVYSEQIQSLVTTWQDTLSLNKTTSKADDEHNDIDSLNDINGAYHPHHKHVVNKLSSQLDDLLMRSQDLSESRDKLNEDYHDLESKHQTTHDDLLSTREELESVKKNYEESLSSINNTGKALEISEKELEKYRSSNKKLQEEIDNIKLHSIDSPTQRDGSMSPKDDARFNIKLNDLKAELFIVKEDRDSMKDEILELKKKLYNMDSN